MDVLLVVDDNSTGTSREEENLESLVSTMEALLEADMRV